MSNATDHFESLYVMHRQALQDLNRLGRDFGEAIAERAPEYTKREEYSYGGKSLVLRTCHTWLAYQPVDEEVPPEQQVFSFAACVAYFERQDAGRWKLTPVGRPELWFFMGTVCPPPASPAQRMQTFFNENELHLFTPKPELGGKVSRYSADDADGRWGAAALGYELGDITSVDDLLKRAVEPMLSAARDASIAAV